jgi:site-specific recombinase XerD
VKFSELAAQFLEFQRIDRGGANATIDAYGRDLSELARALRDPEAERIWFE